MTKKLNNQQRLELNCYRGLSATLAIALIILLVYTGTEFARLSTIINHANARLDTTIKILKTINERRVR